MYAPLPLPPHANDPELARVVRNALDPRLHDVHTMLRLPLKAEGLEAGCNFSIADTLFGVIEGVSAVLWPRHSAPSVLGGILYERFRSPMQHALGLALKQPDRQGIRERDAAADPMVVFRDKESLDERHIEPGKQRMEYAARHLTPPVDQTMSSAGGRIVHTQHYVTLVNSDATAAAVSSVDTTWLRDDPSK
jgi:hypothetical protein